MENLLENDLMIDKDILQNIDWDSLDFSLYPTRSMYIAKCKERILLEIRRTPELPVLQIYEECLNEFVSIIRSYKSKCWGF